MRKIISIIIIISIMLAVLQVFAGCSVDHSVEEHTVNNGDKLQVGIISDTHIPPNPSSLASKLWKPYKF